jgi:hypothetical protein
LDYDLKSLKNRFSMAAAIQPININMSSFVPQGQDVAPHNVADVGDIGIVINEIKTAPGADSLIQVNAYFDCLSQLYNMRQGDHPHRDSCISELKYEIYRFAKAKSNKQVVLHSILTPRVAENESLRETVKKVEYLAKQTCCSGNPRNCCLRNTRFSHHLSNIYGHPASTQVTAGQSLFAGAATGLIAAGAAIIVANPGTMGLAVGIPVVSFGGAIIAGTIISAASSAGKDNP